MLNNNNPIIVNFGVKKRTGFVLGHLLMEDSLISNDDNFNLKCFLFCRNFHYILFHYSCSSCNIITLSIIWLLCYIMSYHIIINLTLIIIHSITSCHFIPSLYHISYLSHYIILILYTLISYQYIIISWLDCYLVTLYPLYYYHHNNIFDQS